MISRMRPRPQRAAVTTFLASSLLALTAATGAAAQCAQETRIEALHVHEVKTRLMVAALACEARSEYASFVNRFSPALSRNGEALKSYFRGEYGAQSNERLNAFVTRLANKVSQENSTDPGAFCAFSRELFETVITLADDKIASALPDERRTAQRDDRTCLVQLR